MSNQHIENLDAVRNSCIKKRRALAGNANNAISESKSGASWAEEIAKLQNEIEVLDRAILDEKKWARSPTPTYAAYKANTD